MVASTLSSIPQEKNRQDTGYYSSPGQAIVLLVGS
jgi:hypothetical protein